jgi:hypothetical protein
VFQILVDNEQYEMAQLAKDALEGYCATYNMDVPKPITDIEDYKLEFWRFGLSGEIATANLSGYIDDCYSHISQTNNRLLPYAIKLPKQSPQIVHQLRGYCCHFPKNRVGWGVRLLV